MSKKVLSVIAIVIVCVFTMALFSGCAETKDDSSKPATSDSTTKKPEETKKDLSGNVKTGGSTSVDKVMQALIFQFREDNKKVTIDYEMNGSGDGIKNAISGLYEIGHSSRALKDTEKGVKATAYAIDGIAVILHPENKVNNLTADQIKKIYAGEIKNWKEVGGADKLITVVTREDGSGTRSAFMEILKLEAIVASATTSDSTGAVQTTVSQNQDAIGYMSFSDVDAKKVKTCQYDGVDIKTETLKDGSYKLKREFYLVTKEGATLSEAGQAFIDFILSDAGQAIVKNNKLLPIK